MRRFPTSLSRRVAPLAAAALLASSAAWTAEPVPEITIRADRPTSKVIGRSSSGAPIRLYELSYRLSYADLDLSTSAGADALKQRVREAADSVCKDLDKLYPDIEPDRGCSRKAEDDSMAQARRAIERAQARTQKQADKQTP